MSSLNKCNFTENPAMTAVLGKLKAHYELGFWDVESSLEWSSGGLTCASSGLACLAARAGHVNVPFVAAAAAASFACWLGDVW